MKVRIYSSFMESFVNELDMTVKRIHSLLDEKGISHVFIGATALNYLGYHRMTEDIDILVDEDDKEKMKQLPVGFIREVSHGRYKVFLWSDPKTKVEVIYSGEISGDGINGLKFDHPVDMTELVDGIPILPLEKFIEYKLSSGVYGRRSKDFGDVESLIKLYKLDANFSKDMRDDLKKEYAKCLSNTQNEKEL